MKRHPFPPYPEKGATHRGAFFGRVVLESIAGRQIVVHLPARDALRPIVKRNRRFHRLLSRGWRVVGLAGRGGAAGESAPKQTSLVLGNTKTGEDSHGGDHASGEVEDSPNAAAKPRRGCRGGRRAGPGAEDKGRRLQRMANGIYSIQPLQASAATRRAAEQVANLLESLVGRASQRIQRGTEVNVPRLLEALEVGEDPIPAIEWPRMWPQCRVVVTPDSSGSTVGWSGVGRAWALQLASNPAVEVVYADNFNGMFSDVTARDVREFLAGADLVIYLGDGDGYSLCVDYARLGAAVIALDCYASRYGSPRASRVVDAPGTLIWVSRVSSRRPETWVQGIQAALKAW